MSQPYPRTVVLGVSGAPTDEAPLAWALDECLSTGARLVLAHACAHGHDEGYEPAGGHPGVAASIERARRVLGGEAVTVRVQPPPPGLMLTGLVTSTDLVVVGPPARGQWMRWGSTTHDVARHAPCPVVIARPTCPEVHAPFAGHVVVGIDGSAAADTAAGFAFAYAHEHSLPVVAVTVSTTGGRDIWYDDELLELHLTTEPPALQLLSATLEPWQRAYPRTWVKRAVFSGCAADALIRAAQGARLLVVGAHGGEPGHRVLLGVTTLELINRATCPIAVRQPPTGETGQSTTHKEVHHVRA